jgi:hypothetical protein
MCHKLPSEVGLRQKKSEIQTSRAPRPWMTDSRIWTANSLHILIISCWQFNNQFGCVSNRDEDCVSRSFSEPPANRNETFSIANSDHFGGGSPFVRSTRSRCERLAPEIGQPIGGECSEIWCVRSGCAQCLFLAGELYLSFFILLHIWRIAGHFDDSLNATQGGDSSSNLWCVLPVQSDHMNGL